MAKKFNIKDEGQFSDYLGVKVTHKENGNMSLTQPQLIDSILRTLGLLDGDKEAKPRDTPALTNKLIGPDKDGEPFDYDWNYLSVMGQLNFLEKSTRASFVVKASVE